MAAGGGAQSGDRLPASAGGRERNAVEFEETDHPALYCDMERELLSKDKVRRVKSAVEKLSPNQRQVIELAYFEGSFAN